MDITFKQIKLNTYHTIAPTLHAFDCKFDISYINKILMNTRLGQALNRYNGQEFKA